MAGGEEDPSGSPDSAGGNSPYHFSRRIRPGGGRFSGHAHASNNSRLSPGQNFYRTATPSTRTPSLASGDDSDSLFVPMLRPGVQKAVEELKRQKSQSIDEEKSAYRGDAPDTDRSVENQTGGRQGKCSTRLKGDSISGGVSGSTPSEGSPADDDKAPLGKSETIAESQTDTGSAAPNSEQSSTSTSTPAKLRRPWARRSAFQSSPTVADPQSKQSTETSRKVTPVQGVSRGGPDATFLAEGNLPKSSPMFESCSPATGVPLPASSSANLQYASNPQFDYRLVPERSAPTALMVSSNTSQPLRELEDHKRNVAAPGHELTTSAGSKKRKHPQQSPPPDDRHSLNQLSTVASVTPENLTLEQKRARIAEQRARLARLEAAFELEEQTQNEDLQAIKEAKKAVMAIEEELRLQRERENEELDAQLAVLGEAIEEKRQSLAQRVETGKQIKCTKEMWLERARLHAEQTMFMSSRMREHGNEELGNEPVK